MVSQYRPAPFRPAPYRLGQASGSAQDIAEALRRQGAIVTIQIGVPSTLAAQLQQQGKPVPPPQTVKGMVDTGASISTVSEAVAQAAGLQQVGTVPLYGVGGGGEKPVFAASFVLPDYGATVDPIELGGVTIGMPGVDMLVGRDVLRALRLDYVGPQGQFSLTTGQDAAPYSPGAPAGGGGGMSTGTWILLGVGAAVLVGAGLLALKAI